MVPSSDLNSTFSRYFEIITANTPELLSQAFQLRFQVYCLEGKIPGFKLEDYPNSEESDEYDQRSVHGLLLHRQNGTIAGTVRLVLPDSREPRSAFPVEAYAGALHEFSQSNAARHQVAEISRFILSPHFRSRKGEQLVSDGLPDARLEDLLPANDRRNAPHPILGLIKSCVLLSWEHGIRYWCAGMEPRLHRRLKQFGMGLTQVTPVIEYYGPVNVYFSYIPDVMRGCHEQCPEIWRFLTDNGRIWPADNADSSSMALA